MFKNFFILLSIVCLFSISFATGIKVTNLDKGVHQKQLVNVPLFELIELTTGVKQDSLTNIKDIVKVTQEHWMNDNVVSNTRIGINTQKIKVLAKELGFVDSIYPKITTLGIPNKYDAILVLGAKHKVMRDRIIFLKSLFGTKKISSNVDIYLLGSDRPLTEEEFGLIQGGTETSDLVALANKYTLNSFGEVLTVDPHCEHKGSRCITDDTIEELVKLYEFKLRGYKNILVISNQPYVHYQDKVVKHIFKQKGISVNVETVGFKAYNSIPAYFYLKNIAKDLYMDKKLNYNN